MACSLLVCTALLAFSLAYIRHYPLTVSLVSLFLLRTIFDAKVEKIIVWEDRVEIVTRYLLPFLTVREMVRFDAVESIRTPVEKQKMAFIYFKDGYLKELAPAVHRAQFQKAMGVIGTLTTSLVC